MKKFLSCVLCVVAVLSVSAAETVAKFTSLEAGAKSGAYTIGENGRTITSGAAWSVADGTTVVVEYSGLSLSGTQAIVTLAQSNDSSDLSKVGICSSDGVLKGVWQNAAWTGGENTGYELAESGCLVFVYYPDANTRGVFVYDREGTEIFRAKGLKSTGPTVTMGARFDIGATASGGLSQEGFTVNSVRIYRGFVAAADVPLLVASTSDDITLPNGTYTVSHVLSGAGAVTADAGANGVITLGAANTFTGGLTVKSGTLKTTNATGFGPNRWNNTANLATIAVEAGATLDLGNTKDSCYAITSAGTLTNSGSAIGSTNRQTTRLTLTGDTTVTGNQFGLLGPGYAATTLALGEHTLTVNMASAETSFILCTATVTGSGKIRLEQGKLYLKKAITGTLNIDLPAVPEDGETLFALDGERDLSKLNLHVTVDGAELPANVTVSKEGVVSVIPDSSPIVRDDAAKTWTLDTTEAAYALVASEIRDLKASAVTFTLKSESEYGATIDLGSNTTSQKAHYVFASGSHTLKWAAGSLGNGSLDFDTTGTEANPSILVKKGATLNFVAKDVTGWKHDAKAAKTSVIKVESGATLKLYRNGDNTWFFQGLLVVEPGATVEAVDFGTDKFRLNGGVYADWQELVVPTATETDNAVVFASNVGFRLAKDETTGYGINVGEGSTLTLEGDLTSDGARDLGKFGTGTLVVTGSLSGFSGEIKIDSGSVKVKATSGLAEGKVVQFEEDDAREIVATPDGEWIVYTNVPKFVFDPEKDVLASEPVLRFSEIMPKPSDKPGEITTQAGYDKNGLESGWVELENTSDRWVDLGDYKFCRANRGKVYTHADYGNFPTGTYIPPHGRFTFYTSERYSNSYPEAKDGNTSAFQHGTFDGKPIWYDGMLIWGDKVNPKKFPYVTLVYRPSAATSDQILETVIIPSDTPEGYSIIVGHDEGEGVATQRWLCPSPTKNAENSDTTNLKKIGPNVGPAYGTKHSATEFGPTAPAKPGEPYTVSLNVNPVYTAAGTRPGDEILSVTLVYRRDLDDATLGEATMTKTGTDEGGDVWTGTIPAEAIPVSGHLLQWKTRIVDASSNTWTSPSFMNPDDGYEWFGTITEPGELNSAKLPTWHMFIDDASKAQMDVDADQQTLPNNARVAIYDASTSNYYDYVRIDLRGNTSAHFNKKSHGLRFSKAHPLTMKDTVRGGEVKEIRKSSLIGEPADPSFMRQMVAFWLWDKMGNKVPFDFPVRCNLNGAFYQLAFHSERFTDELIEDVYGFDKYGYGYKNVGTLRSGSGTTAGGIEKKTPDDGHEGDVSVLQNDLRKPLADLGIDGLAADDNAERPLITKFVVEKFDLPAWLNYLASARITQEMDDVWANISMYKDDAEMKEGSRGTGTWMPLGYDFNLTFGQWYFNDVGSGSGLMAANDWFKSHPFYGGNVVRCYKQAAMTSTCNEGNRGIEAVWQSAKFRRLYLRRLRTLMDQELKAPGTAEEDVPFMAKMRELAALMEEDAVLDRKRWPHDGSIGNIDVWRGEVAWPATMAAGIDDIWNNYVVPRQTHLYVTHSVTNTAKTVGYATTLNAGIPEAQSSLEVLKEGLTAEAVDGGIVIRNANDETIDLSGWDVTGPVVMKLPAGTVVDRVANGKTGEVFVVTDRRAYVAAHAATLTDEVIVGNAALGSGTDIGLAAADGTVVLSADVILSPGTYTGVSYDVPVRLAPAGAFTFQGVKFNGGLAMGDGTFTLKNQNGYTNTASVVDAPTANIVFIGKGAFEMVGTADTTAPLMTVGDLYVSNGVFSVESKATTAGVKAVVVAGDFVVEDKGTVSVKLSKKTVAGVGISQELKNKVCRIGSGGKFLATVNGANGSALLSEKGTVDLLVAENATVTAEGVGANARFFKMDGNIRIAGGTLDLQATGKGAELLSSGKTVFISGGALHLESTDDCVSAAKAINVSGGTIVGKSSANDVLDSNGTIDISGGTLVLLATAEGHEGLDSDPNPPDEKDHAITITGGVVYSLGGANCDLRVPEADGQAYCVAELEDAAGYVAVSDGAVRHVFVKPAGARTALVSLAGLTGAATTPAALAADATTVVAECYWTEAISADTPTWEDAEVTDATPLAELVPAEQAAILKGLAVKPTTLATWAKTHHAADMLGTAIDLVAFALDCATSEVAEKKKAFKVTIAFDPETGKPVVTKAEGVSLNVEPAIKGSVDLINWHDREEDDRFFKAVIRLEE